MPQSRYPYLSNLSSDIRLVGYPAFLYPFPQHTSSSRLDMYASHIDQALSIEGAEFPALFTGMEGELLKYNLDSSRREQAAEIIARIPKYPPRFGDSRLGENPSTLVIYRGLDDRMAHYCTVESFTLCSDGYGYANTLVNQHLLQPGYVLEPNTTLQHPPEIKGPKFAQYCLGVNLRTVFLTLPETIEDAMLISKSAAKKMKSTAYYKRTIRLRANEHPLNLYGDELEFRFLPDIGDHVREDGLLYAARPISTGTFTADLFPGSLREFHALHDRQIHAPGGKVVDIEVHMPKKIRAKVDSHVYAQAIKYHKASMKYWETIVAVYQQCRRDKIAVSPEFSSLVTTAMGRLIADGNSVPGVPQAKSVDLIGRGGKPIDFIEIDITYAVERSVEYGFKITGRDGAKGVTCRIVDDEDMPLDAYGFRAELAIDPGATIARMNEGQLYEQAITRTAEFVRRKIEALHEAKRTREAIDTLFDFYNDIHPNYAVLLKELYPTERLQISHLQDCIRTRIYLNIPPFLETMLHSSILTKLEEKWEVKTSPVTFTVRDRDGSNPRVVTTLEPALIGDKYIMLLCKLPDPASAGVARISHFGAAVKSPADMKDAMPISINPIRFGEDEMRIRAMDVPVEEDMRWMCLQANSPKGVEVAVETLLAAEYPTRIDRMPISTAALIQSNSVLRLFHHLMATLGIESQDVATDMPVMALGEDADLPDDVEESDDEDGLDVLLAGKALAKKLVRDDDETEPEEVGADGDDD